MIFFLIAGTATPAFLLANRGPFGLVCLIGMWTLTLTAAAVHLALMSAPEVVVGGAFVGLGWVAGLALPGVWIHAGVAPAMLVLAGGLLYTAGALSYHRRRPDPYPSVFGYHEIFHAYVCALESRTSHAESGRLASAPAGLVAGRRLSVLVYFPLP